MWRSSGVLYLPYIFRTLKRVYKPTVVISTKLLKMSSFCRNMACGYRERAGLTWATSMCGEWCFIGFAGFYHRFIKDFSKIARPLHKALQKNRIHSINRKGHRRKNTPMQWNQAQRTWVRLHQCWFLLTIRNRFGDVTRASSRWGKLEIVQTYD